MVIVDTDDMANMVQIGKFCIMTGKELDRIRLHSFRKGIKYQKKKDEKNGM